MTQIAISDKVAATLAAAAASCGCNQEDLASLLIEEGLHRGDQFELTPEMEARLLESIAQAERGELIDGDIIMDRFRKVLREIESR